MEKQINKLFRCGLIAAAIFFTAIPATAYNITGQVVDRTDNAELAGATITVRKDSISVLTATSADAQGKFVISGITVPDVWIDVQMIGYKGVRTVISGNSGENINLDIIALSPMLKELGEVTVTGSGVIQKPDRYLVIPSLKELGRASSSLNLLNNMQMKMPGLRVNEMLQSVTIDNRTPVFQLNGKEVSLQRILGINNDNILRIEYHDNPDIKYADRGVPGIVNFITKPARAGGSVQARAVGALMTGFLNADAGVIYNYKKSEWAFNYATNWRKYDEQYVNRSEQFIGRESPIERESTSLPSEKGSLYHHLALGYTFMPDLNTMFSATLQTALNGNIYTNVYADDKETRGEQIYEQYRSFSGRHSSYVDPSADIYFRKQLDKKSKIELNAFTQMSYGDYDRTLSYDYTDDKSDYYQKSTTENNSWRAGVEGAYSRSYPNFTTNYGIKYYHNDAENRYTENANPTIDDRLKTEYLYAYGSINGRVKNFGYSAGIGGVYAHTRASKREKDAFRPKINITLNYRMPKNWSLNYLFMYDPKLPTLAQQSETMQIIDDISLRMGNMALKPSSWFRNRIYLRYFLKKFTGTFWVSHSRTVDTQFDRFSYISDTSSPYYDKFISQTQNGGHDDRINFQLDLGFKDLFGHLSIYYTAGWDRYNFTGFGDIDSDKNFYSNISAQLYFGKWTIMGNFEITPQYILAGNEFSRSQRFNTFQVQYHHKNWYVIGGVANPFTKRGWLMRKETMSDVHPVVQSYYIKDNANMVSLGFVYRLNFGETIKKASRTIENKGIDTGVADY